MVHVVLVLNVLLKCRESKHVIKGYDMDKV